MIIGIDEVGRGCWAGPLVAAAVSFVDARIPAKLTDSKLLSRSSREGISRELYVAGHLIGIGWVWPLELDNIGLTDAVRLAMRRALADLGLDPSDTHDIIIDGSYNFLVDVPGTSTLVRGDALLPAISAASVVAKVARDSYMSSISDQYEPYGFASNVGYGTKKHRDALSKHGVTAIHRRSFAPVKERL